jgi:hypothetical protein
MNRDFIEGFEKTAGIGSSMIRAQLRNAKKVQNSAKQAITSSGVTKQTVKKDAFEGYSNRAKEQASKMNSKAKFKNALGF